MNPRYITLSMVLLVLSLSSGCAYKGYEEPTLRKRTDFRTSFAPVPIPQYS